MTVTPLGDARDHLSEYVSDVQRTHDRVTITRHGQAAAVLVSAEELAALDETVDILSTPGAVDEIRQGARETAEGDYVTADEMAHTLARRRSSETDLE